MPKIKLFILPIILTMFLLPGCGLQPDLTIKSINMQLTSLAFANNQNIPILYTCDGANTNPPLEIANVPANAQSLALISDDPDASMGTWVHWLVWNIDPKTSIIESGKIPAGSIEGKTSFGSTGYGGPCPPSGTHRYFFKLYALDIKLDLTPNAGKDNLEKAMQKHILDSAELIGIYKRQK